MTIGRSQAMRGTTRDDLKPRAWKARKRFAGDQGAERKLKLNRPLNERPGYLLWRARHIADSIYAYECRDFGITSSQYVVLAVVKETPGTDQVSVSRIAGLDRFTTALVLTNLIKRKLIIRERSSTDHRRYCLRPSAQGLDMLKRVQPSLARARLKRILLTALFFGSLVAIFALLIWVANRYPAAPNQPRKSYRGN